MEDNIDILTDNDRVNEALQRLLNIRWEENDPRVKSHILLLREYLRRSSLWARALGCLEDWPFFDVTLHLYPDLRVNQDVVSKLMKHLAKFYLSKSIKQTCEWFVHWKLIENKPKVDYFNLPEPYEPLIRMYERGGNFYTEHGFFNISLASFQKGTWDKYYSISPLIELDDDSLDQLDCQIKDE